MDIENLANVLRSMASTPSRRAVSRALLGFGAGSGLAQLFDPVSGEAKKGGGNNNKKKKKKKKSPPPPPPPPPPQPPTCQFGQETCGPAGACCPELRPRCCRGTINSFCYSPNEETCCDPTATGQVGACAKGRVCGPEIAAVRFCCNSGDEICRGGCCVQGTFCCTADGVCCNNVACQPAPAGTCFVQDVGEGARIQ